jgi:hypothetical protein
MIRHRNRVGLRRRLATAGICLWLFAGAGATEVFGQYPQPLSEAPTAPQFMARYDFHLAAGYLRSDDPTFFMWDTHWGGDFDLVDYVSGRFGFLADYQAILGDQLRPFDPNQGNYTLEFSGSQRLGRTELAGVFHHVSRHLSDRLKQPAVAMNAVEARLLRRVGVSPTTFVDVKVEGGKVIARAYVDYTWMGKLDITARRQVNGIAGAYGRVLGELYATDVTVAGRGTQKGGRIEAGIRLRGKGGAMDLFAGWERMVDADLFDRRPRSWPFAGFRLVN